MPLRKRAFTLVELLTVVAIIALLISVLVPSLSAARNAARKSSTRSLIDAVGKGAEMFNTEFGHYPQSRGRSPFHFSGGGRRPDPTTGSFTALEGAQWAVVQLSGADLQGYVDPDNPGNDTGDPPDGVIDRKDWNEWYSLEPERRYGRSGPYVDATQGKNTATLNQLIAEAAIVEYDRAVLVDPPGSKGLGTGDVPMYVDAWRRPVLYYRANIGAQQPFTTGRGHGRVGLYDHSDNAGITGSEGNDGQLPRSVAPMVFNSSKPFASYGPGLVRHPMGYFDYEPGDRQLNNKYSFEWWMTDLNIFESTRRNDEGKIVPYRADSFILVSAGQDGVYGSNDDVWNFTR